MKILRYLFVVVIGAALAATSQADPIVLRVGHFPNVTHAQGVIAHALSGKGKGWFEERLGPDVKIQWFVYNAGPSATEAIFANSIDLTYIGPSPALNAYAKSSGDEVRIIAGAANGGAALVVQPDGRIKVPADFRGKKVATPQLGNTQDVACRSWLAQQGFKVTQLGGDVFVVPTANPDQLNLFKQGDVDAVWTVEPWVSRLEMESGAKVFLEQKDTITTVLVSSARFLHDHRDLAKKFAQVHAELTDWIQKNPEEAQKILREELAAETTRAMSADLVVKSWKRLQFTTEVSQAPFVQFVADAQRAGFMRTTPDLKRLVEIP
jgi:sulfonate transport system substrate-binding protein